MPGLKQRKFCSREQDEKYHDAVGIKMNARLVVRKSTVKDAPEDWNLVDW